MPPGTPGTPQSMAPASATSWLAGVQQPGMAGQVPWWEPTSLGAPAGSTPTTENAQELDLQAWYIHPAPLFGWLVNPIVEMICLHNRLICHIDLLGFKE